MMSSIDFNKVGVLKDEIEILQRRADAQESGMGNYYTAINILKQRVRELGDNNDTVTYPFLTASSDRCYWSFSSRGQREKSGG